MSGPAYQSNLRELAALRGMFSTWDLFEPLAEPGTEQAPPVSDGVTRQR